MSQTTDEIVSLVFSNMSVSLPFKSPSEDVRRFWRPAVQELTPEMEDGKKVLKIPVEGGVPGYDEAFLFRKIDDDVERVEHIEIEPIPFDLQGKVTGASVAIETDVLLDDLKNTFGVEQVFCHTVLGNNPHLEIEIVVEDTLYILTIMYTLEEEAEAEFSLES